MDPELMQLLALARNKKNNSNMSSVLGNLDNPMLAFLSGAYSPSVDTGYESMPLTASYADSADPVVQQILQQVNTGIDEYALRSWLTNRLADSDFNAQVSDAGWQEDDLASLAVGLQKEKAKASTLDNDTWWAKAGIADPSEVYDEFSVPLDQKSAEQIADVRLGSSPAKKMLSQAKMMEKRAEREAAVEKKSLDDFKKKVRSFAMYDPSTVMKGHFWKLQYALDDLPDDVSEKQLSDLVEKYVPQGHSGYTKRYREQIEKAGIPKMTGKQRSRVSEAQEDVGLAEQQMNAAQAAEMAIRRGRTRAFQEAGRTPTGDQMKQMLRFMTGM